MFFRKPRIEVDGPGALLAIGQRVRGARLALRWSQIELAGRAHVHKHEIHLLETARKPPHVDDLARLARALKVDPQFLLTGTLAEQTI